MNKHTSFAAFDRVPPLGSLEARPRLLSTYDNLLQQRRTEVYSACLSELRRHTTACKEIASGEAAARSHTRMVFDVSTSEYERDYAELEDFFSATPLNERLVEIRPIDYENEDDIYEAIGRTVAASPFHQRLSDVTAHLDTLVSLSPEPGTYRLPVALSDDGPVDQLVAPTICDGGRIKHDEQGNLIIDIVDTNETDTALYLHTNSAMQLCHSLDDAGIALSASAQCELALENDHRYGNAYAWMSRELVKSIAGYSSSLLDTDIRAERLPEFTDDEGANLLIDTIRQIALRGEGPDFSSIPVTSEYVNLRDKGCKDAEYYFASSADMPGKLQTVAIAGKQFWHKTHGGHTYINLEPIVYCGVEVAPGHLFKQADDGGYALLRVTGFAFDKQTADQLFGAPMTDVYEMSGEEDRMVAAFDRFQADRAKVTQS